MSEHKYTLPKFDGKPTSDFRLWLCRLEAILEDKSILYTIGSDVSTAGAARRVVDDQDKVASDKSKAAAIMVGGLGDKPLRLVVGVRKDPAQMMKKLNERYASSKLTTRMTLMTSLTNMTYKGGDMTEYVDTYASTLDRLEAMDAKVPTELSVIMFLASMKGHFAPTVAALRTMSDDSLRWDDVTARLIEEADTVKAARGSSSGSALVATTLACDFCGKHGHTKDRCWQNPDNPNNRLSSEASGSTTSKRSKRANVAQSGRSRATAGRSGDGSKSGRRGRGRGTKSESDSDSSDDSDASTSTRQRGSRARHHVLVARGAPRTVHVGHSAHDPQSTSLILDSGASGHMCPVREWLHDFAPCEPTPISLGDDSQLQCTGTGTLRVDLHSKSRGENIAIIRTVQYTPGLAHTLLSCSALAEKRVSTVIDKAGCTLYQHPSSGQRQLLATCTLRDGLYYLDGTAQVVRQSANTASASQVDMWHQRLGHTNHGKVRKLMNTGGLSASDRNAPPCADCVDGKQARRSFAGHFSAPSSPGDVVHSDVVGPLPRSKSGSRYMVSFVDEYSRWTTIFVIQKKTFVTSCFREFMRSFEREHNTTIKCVHSDNGGEYDALARFAKRRGIRIQRSAPYTPQSNGIAERQNRSIFEMARTSLLASGLPQSFWAEAVSNAVSVRNRLPDAGGVSPYERLYSRKPSLSRFRPFGCLAFALVHEKKRKKLHSKSDRCILLCTLDHGNYRLMSLRSGRVFECTHVRFDESNFPGASLGEPAGSPEVLSDAVFEPSDVTDGDTDGSTSSGSTSEDDDADVASSSSDIQVDSESDSSGEGGDSGEHDDSQSSSAHVSPPSVPVRRYPARQRNTTPALWRNSAHMASATPSTEKENPPLLDASCHIASSNESDSPTLRQAMNSQNSEQWQTAIAEELQSLNDAGTWELVDAPRGARVFPSKFVLKIKRHSDGSLERYKARLVLLGHLQRPNVDFYDTYAPVADFTVVRIILALACCRGWYVRQFDVKTAFLNGELDEEIYMRLPEGFQDARGQVCRLLRSIYGLRQAPRAWSKKLCDDLLSAGFRPLVHAESVFRSTAPSPLVLIVIYVDDILVISHDKKAVNQVEALLSSLYTIKDLGDAEYFLGVKIERSPSRIKLTQTSYINSMLERYGMSDSKPAPTPMVQPVDLMATLPTSDANLEAMKSVPFREAIGSLLYLAVRTRPDIAVAVSILAKHSNAPGRSHWEAVKRIMRYLKQSSEQGLVYTKSDNVKLSIYCDSDWATDPNDRHSRTGVLCLVGDCPVSWTSRKQTVPSVSSCEAEYIALFEAGRDAVWIRNLLCELGECPDAGPTTVLHDNQGSIAWAEGGMRRVKHVELKYHYTQHLIKTRQIRVEYVASEDNKADGLTKALVGLSFKNSVKSFSIA